LPEETGMNSDPVPDPGIMLSRQLKTYQKWFEELRGRDDIQEADVRQLYNFMYELERRVEMLERALYGPKDSQC